MRTAIVPDPVTELDRIQNDLVRVLANPVRLAIARILGDGELEVGQIARALGLSAPLVSQNLAAMRAAGIVEPSREGRTVHYRLSDPDILRACDLLRDVIRRRITALGTLVADSRAGAPATKVTHA